MIGTERFLLDRQRPLVQRLGIGIATLVLVEPARLFSDLATSGWSGPSAFSRIASDSLVERLGIGIATLVTVKLRQIVQRCRDIGMVGTERFFTDRQRRLKSGSASA